MKKIIGKINSLFIDKKNRYLRMFLFMLPFIVAIVIFGIITFKDVKGLLNIVTNTETSEEYVIKSQDYLLRDNATDLQLELFAELKSIVENTIEHTDVDLAVSVCKNFVADFYTWTNKAGQYDVGGMYYVYTPQRQTIYLQARDEFYKYINDYINRFGKENLLEVISVEATGKKLSDKYSFEVVDEENSEDDLEENEVEEKPVTSGFDAYSVTCNWEYKESEKFKTNSFAKKLTFTVIDNEGRFEIVEVKE